MDLILQILELVAAVLFAGAVNRIFSIDRTLKLILLELRARRTGEDPDQAPGEQKSGDYWPASKKHW